MNEYMLIFRNEKAHDELKPTAEQMGALMKEWQIWISTIAKQGNYSGTNRLLPQGKTIRPGNVISDGPFLEAKEMLGGYVIVKTASLDEATDIAKACPNLLYGGNVEVRPVMNIDSDPTSATFLDPVN
ncbi:MAG: YciI family protein [Ferruginibacter sp.]